MTVGDAVRQRIIELCRERNLSFNKLATQSGVTQSTLNNKRPQQQRHRFDRKKAL